MARVPTLEELTARIRAGEAVPAGSMKDAFDHEVTVATVGAIPVVLGAPAILGTPELDAKFTGLWRKACRQAGIKPQEVPSGD